MHVVSISSLLFQLMHFTREHMWCIRTNNPNLAYVMQILNNKHEYGTANETLKLLKPCNKGLKMNCWESFYIQIYRQRNRLITELLTGDYNSLCKQAYFPCDLQHIPWHSLHQICTHTHTHTHTNTHTHTHTYKHKHTRTGKSILFYTYNSQYFRFRIG
jgi:hypothetical protein